jgi:hypothetical protein
MRRLLTGTVAALVVSVAGSSSGQSDSFLELSWRAPEECPSQAEVEAQVAELLGGPTAAASRVKAQVHAWRGEDALWHVEIRTVTGSVEGERLIDGETCASIAGASALILAMAVDPEAVAAKAMEVEAPTWDPSVRPPPLSVKPQGGAVGPRLSPPLPAIPSPGEVIPPEPVGTTLAPLVGLDVGTLPNVAPWFGGAVGLSRGDSRLEARLAFLPQQEKTLSDRPMTGGRFDLTAFGVTFCREVTGRAASLSLCGGVEVGMVRARGFGVTDPAEANPIWLSLTPGLLGHWPLSTRLSLRLEAMAGVPLRRPGFDLEPYGEVHRASPVVGRFSVGPQLHFP